MGQVWATNGKHNAGKAQGRFKNPREKKGKRKTNKKDRGYQHLAILLPNVRCCGLIWAIASPSLL